MALIGNISGSSRDASHVGITGSVIIANATAPNFPSFPGTDVVFFVSGSISGSGVNDRKSVFGGDLVVSGGLTVHSGTTLYGDVTEITGDELIISGTLLVSGNTVMNGDLTVTGSIYSTNGAEFLGGGLEVSGSLLVSGGTDLNGNLVVSGTVTSTMGFSGSLTQLVDGTSYLIAGDNISIVTGSNGALTITSSISGINAGGSLTGSYPNPTLINRPTLIWAPGKTPSDNLFSDWSSLMTAFSSSKGIVNIEVDGTDSAHLAYFPAGTWDLESRARFIPRYPGDDFPYMYATGSVVLKNPYMFEGVGLFHSNNTAPVILLSSSVTNFAYPTPSLIVDYGGIANFSTQPTIRLTNSDSFAQVIFKIGFYQTNLNKPLLEMPIAGQSCAIYSEYGLQQFQGAANVISGAAGTSLTLIYDSNIDGIPTNPNFLGTTTLYPTSNSKFVTYDDTLYSPALGSSTAQGAIDLLKLRPQYFTSTVAGSIFTTGSAAFRGGESSVSSPSNKGSDVFFYVSGSKGNGSGKSLFGGDVVISGSLNVMNGMTGSLSGTASWTTQTFSGAGPFTASLVGFVSVAPGADPTVLKLPSGAPDGFQMIVKRRDQVVNSYILQISGSNSDTIDDGGGTAISTNYGSMSFVKLGSGWYVT